MPIAILVLVLAAYVYVLAAVPEWRIPGIVLGALATAGLGAYLVLTEPEAETAAHRIPPEAVVLSTLDFERTARGGVLSGRIENTSPDFRLREMTVTLRLHDCPPDTSDELGCPVIAEDTALVHVDVPPRQIRAFTAPFVFVNMPSVLGELRWTHHIDATRATP
jgi:hypothetical protein